MFVAFLNVIIIVGTEFYFDDLISTLLFDNAMFLIGEYFCVNTFDVSQTNKNTEKKWKKNRNERERTKNHIKRNNENNVENLMRMLNQHTEREALTQNSDNNNIAVMHKQKSLLAGENRQDEADQQINAL